MFLHVCAALVLGFGIVPAFSDAPGPDTPSQPAAVSSAAADLRVFDGDTLHDRAQNVTYRIENIDTPETGDRARCAAERAHAARATCTVRAMIRSARDLDIYPAGRTDRYDRVLARVSVDGRDLGETLIEAGLARPWRGRREPWCDVRGDLIL